MNHYVVFSGGYDSTLVLLKVLTDNLEKLKSAEDKLFIFTYSGVQGKNKSDKEIQSRKKTLEYIKAKYNYTPTEINIHWDFSINSSEDSPDLGQYLTGIHQGPIWIGGLSIFLEYDTPSKIYFGYLSTDKARLFIHELKESFRWQCVITRKFYAELEFPLSETYRKEDVIYELFKNHRDVIDNLVTCENEKYTGKYCGLCNPCKTLQAALYSCIGKYYDNKEEDPFVIWCKNRIKELEEGYNETHNKEEYQMSY